MTQAHSACGRGDSNTEIFCVSSGGASCLLKSSGSTFFQGDAQLDLTVRF